jgi:hypothetical protein
MAAFYRVESTLLRWGQATPEVLARCDQGMSQTCPDWEARLASLLDDTPEGAWGYRQWQARRLTLAVEQSLDEPSPASPRRMRV